MRKYRFPLLSPLISTTPFLLSFIFPHIWAVFGCQLLRCAE